MGGAFTSVADDANAVYWNPAGLVQVRRPELSFSHTIDVQDVKAEYLAVAYPIRRAGLFLGGSGLLVNMADVDKIENSVVTGSQKVRFLTYSGSLAMPILPVFAAGVTVKGINQTLGDFGGNGTAIDAGALVRLMPTLTLGGVVANLGSKIDVGGGVQNTIPQIIRGGASFRLTPRVLLAAEVEKPAAAALKLRGGAEWWASEILALRGGYEKRDSLGSGAGLSLGIGFKSKFERPGAAGGEAIESALDYAYLSMGDLGTTHRLSFGVKF